MAKSFQVHILAADRPFYVGPCESVILPTGDGQYGILAGHSNMIAAVVPGELTYRVPGKENRVVAVSGGLVKVEDDDVLILVDSAVRPQDIDIQENLRKVAAAREAIAQKRSRQDFLSAQAALARAASRPAGPPAFRRGPQVICQKPLPTGGGFCFVYKQYKVYFAALKTATKGSLWMGPSFAWTDQDPRGPWTRCSTRPCLPLLMCETVRQANGLRNVDWTFGKFPCSKNCIVHVIP